MIRYQLRCSRGHGFEGWFKNSSAFAQEVQALTCPICDDPSIEKAIMAPAVVTRGDRPQTAEAESAPSAAEPATNSPPATAPMAVMPPATLSPEQRQLAIALTLVRRLRAHVEANFENVGGRFAEEARKIHYGETEARGIYGDASLAEVESLEEEGIAIAALPNLPKLDG